MSEPIKSPDNKDSQIELFKKKFIRERDARKQAERILEVKALELYHANQELKAVNSNLEETILIRTEALRKSEEKYRGILEGMELGILEIDTEGKILKAYEGFCNMTGYTSAELIGMEVIKLVHSPGKTHEEKVISFSKFINKSGIQEFKTKRKDGSIIWVLVSTAPYYDSDNQLVGRIGVGLEITKRKELEQALKTAKLDAEKAQEAEQQFLANMSHEIRTPLNAVIGMSHLLYDTDPSEEQKEYLDNLKNSAKLLHSLISDILDFTKIESGKIEVQSQPFDLRGTILAIQKTFELKLENQPINISSRIDEKIENLVIGDELLLHQVLFNLIGNAEKFTERGNIIIDVKVLTQFGDFLALQIGVKDTGIGIDKDKLEKVFENFKQAANKKHFTNRSSGLGLSITKQLVELQGGTISVESEKGVGSCFTFNISYKYSDQKVSELVKEPEFDSTLNLKGFSILVAEDNTMNQKYIRRILQKWNTQFDIAGNGKEAVHKAQEKKYDIILMDLQMPVMNGIEAANIIREGDNPNQHTPMIALTASALAEHKNMALAAGMNGFMTKPFSPPQLKTLLMKNFKDKTEQHQNTEVSQESNSRTGDDYPSTITQTELAGIEEGNKVPMQNIKKLNEKQLQDHYGEDWEFATDMFQTFLDELLPDFYRLLPLVESENWDSLYKVAHKVKPSLLLVGLPELQKKLAHLEMSAKKNPNKQELHSDTQQIMEELEAYLPAIKDKLRQMKSHLN